MEGLYKLKFPLSSHHFQYSHTNTHTYTPLRLSIPLRQVPLSLTRTLMQAFCCSCSTIINCVVQFVVLGGYTAFRHFGVNGVDYENNKCVTNKQFEWFKKNLDGPIGQCIIISLLQRNCSFRKTKKTRGIALFDWW